MEWWWRCGDQEVGGGICKGEVRSAGEREVGRGKSLIVGNGELGTTLVNKYYFRGGLWNVYELLFCFSVPGRSRMLKFITFHYRNHGPIKLFYEFCVR